MVRCLRAALAALLLPVLASSGARAATFSVDSTLDQVDANPGDGVCASASAVCTLRAAVQEANALAGADEVDLPAGSYLLTLTGPAEDFAATGDLDVTEDLIVQGAGADVTVIDAGAIDRVLEVMMGAYGQLIDVTVRNGYLTNGTGVGGGGLRNRGIMTVLRCIVSDNAILGMPGAGIYSTGTLDVVDTTIRLNQGENAFGDFGQSGGGIANNGILTVTGSTISGNEVDSRYGGAGLANMPAGEATLTNATISGNYARKSSITSLGGDGGGIRNEGTLTLEHVTVSDNRADGVGNSVVNLDTLDVHASIVGNGVEPGVSSCDGAFTSQGANVFDDASCGPTASDDRLTDTLRIDILADNGGPTETHALLAGSDAIDHVDAFACPATDQRGAARPIDGRLSGYGMCDAGAFERTGDFDVDGQPDAGDNCRFVANAPQTDSGGIGPGSPPDGIGDPCQCGDLTGEGVVTSGDVATLRDFLADPQGHALDDAARSRCAVETQDEPCNVLDVALLIRALSGTGQMLAQACSAATHSSVAGYWRLDETSGVLADSGPSHNDAINMGATYGNGSNGFIDGAIELGGVARLDVADDPTLRSAGVSVAAWIRPDTLATRSIAAKQDTGGFAWSLELLSDGRVRMSAVVPLLGVLDTTSAAPVPTGAWTHVAGTYDPSAGVARIYVNGVDASPVASGASGEDLDHQDPATLVIGARTEAPLDGFDGRVDEMAVFDLALTPPEVAQLYASGPPLAGP